MIPQLLFFVSAAILVYVFFIFPLGLLILGSARPRKIQPRWSQPPTVTMIFSAYNEAATIALKLQNFLEQNYPPDKLNCIVVDDGSTDQTADVVKDFASPRIQLLRQERRRGKTAALNHAAAQARGEVLVFTDANAMFQPDAIRHLMDAFDAEGSIGVVCGELKYQQHPDAISDEESRYWNLEIRLKKAESNLGTLLGANGSIYAMRRELFKPLREDLISDFLEPLLLARQGYRTVYQPLAVSVESSTRSLKSEFRRKTRIVQRGLHGLWVHRELLNPLSAGWLAVQLWSHKVLRWLLPVWLFGILLASALLWGQGGFALLLAAQMICYLAGLAGILMQLADRPPGPLRLPAYVVMLIAALLIGIWGFLRGQRIITWEPQR